MFTSQTKRTKEMISVLTNKKKKGKGKNEGGKVKGAKKMGISINKKKKFRRRKSFVLVILDRAMYMR